MPICTHCGENNLDGTTRCTKCGVALGHQARARVDAKRSQVASAIKMVVWVAAVIIVLIVAPRAYHAAFAGYYRYRLNSVKESAMKMCGGPITDSTTPYQKADIEKCMAADDVVTKAQGDFDNFTKGDKP